MMALFGLGAWGLWRASEISIGLALFLYLLPVLLALILLPLLAYRLYALRSARYLVERDGFHLIWGMRVEDIPMQAVIWVKPIEELGIRLPLPWLRWPGAVVGVRRLRDGRRVEFLSARSRRLVVIGLPEKLYVISPQDPQAFLQACRESMELGSLSPMPSRSVYPGFLLARVWQTPAARSLILIGLLLNLTALSWVILAIPARASITLGFGPGREPVPAARLLLLPVLSISFFLMDFFLGLWLFRRTEAQTSDHPWLGTLRMIPGRTTAYLLWLCGVIVSSLFLTAVISIAR